MVSGNSKSSPSFVRIPLLYFFRENGWERFVIGYASIIGTSTVIRHVQHLVQRFAELDCPVFITGESGTRKDEVARAIHFRSVRTDYPFVCVRCDTNADALERSLFGLEDSSGLVEQGLLETHQEGVIFLDEVGSMDILVQKRLLEFFNTQSFSRIGGAQKMGCKARVILSSSFDLEKKVTQKEFLSELYAKMNNYILFLPPLRDRKEDIPSVVEYYLDMYSRLRGKIIDGISNDALNAFVQYPWKNNIFEMEYMIDCMISLRASGYIDICDLPPKLRKYVTDDVDRFFERSVPVEDYAVKENISEGIAQNLAFHQGTRRASSNARANVVPAGLTRSGFPLGNSVVEDHMTEIEHFINKEIDLGNGIDFYRVVEEFENKLISEALRRTNHNKDRAAQLLSMNRTTLVEKLKKRQTTPIAITSPQGKKMKNASYTVLDGMTEDADSDALLEDLNFMTHEDTLPCTG